MRPKNILLLLLIVFAYSSCKKDNGGGALPGSWYIKSIKGLNGFNNTSGLDFTTGKFTFKVDGAFEYTDATYLLYNGRWSLTELNQTNDCYTDTDGSQVCNSYWDNILQLDASRSAGGPQKKTAYFISFKFIDANNFTAVLAPNGSNPTYLYTFGKSK